MFWRNQLLEKKLDVKDIVQHFKEDLEEYELLTELKMVKNMYCAKNFSYSTFKEKIALYKSIFPQTSRLLQLLLVMPATSATAEQSFSSLRHVKTYLCTTMTRERLNHLMMIYMYIHKDRSIDIEKAMNDFILSCEERIHMCLANHNYSCGLPNTCMRSSPPPGLIIGLLQALPHPPPPPPPVHRITFFIAPPVIIYNYCSVEVKTIQKFLNG